MACECTRCRRLGRAFASAETWLRRPAALPVAAGLTAVLVLLVTVAVGVPVGLSVVFAAVAGAAAAAGVTLLRPRLADDDPLAPLAVERWLCENDDDWPWWVLGGVTAFVGLLLVTSPRAGLPLLAVGGLVAAVPRLRRVLGDCARLA